MNTSFKRAVVCTPLAAALVVCAVSAAGYHLLKTIPVPGDYGWDYASADTEGRRLYVGHDREVVVINLDTDDLGRAFADYLEVGVRIEIQMKDNSKTSAQWGGEQSSASSRADQGKFR